ncbi:unnamed protein product [Acanthocheilonema viteae]|uniref:Uncharacterized protein n=1 Tax=Acanthocheilonema viteae TaxID=6277 RepID=A0A498STS7_ACAVI|nr:unnamed protein product [Acanthocheilonema viteae]
MSLNYDSDSPYCLRALNNFTLNNRLSNGRTDLKYRLNASEVYRSAKVLFTIRNLGQNNTGLGTDIKKTTIIPNVQKQDINSSVEYRTTAHSSLTRENETEIFLESSTIENVSTEGMETGREKATNVSNELLYTPQKESESFDYNEFNQQHVSSTSSMVFRVSTIPASVQHQELDSSYPTDSKEPKSEKYEPVDLSKTYEAPEETILSSDIISKQLSSSFVNNISSFTVNTTSSKITEKQKTSSFSETQEVEGKHGFNIIGTGESYPDLLTNIVSSLIAKPNIPINLPAANTESQESAIQYSDDHHVINILGNTKNSSGTVFQATNVVVSSFNKQSVKPKIQSLLPFHFSIKNGTVISNNGSSGRQISSKQETIPKSFTYFGFNTDKINKSNISNDNVTTTLLVTTDKQTFAPTIMTSEEMPMLKSYHNLSVEEIPNVTSEKESLDKFNSQNGYNSEQQPSLDGGYYPKEQYSFLSNLDIKDSSGNIAEIDEQNSQNNDIYSTKVFPSYQSKEMVEHGEVPIQLGHTGISEQEQQINKMTMSSDSYPSSIDWQSTSAYTITITPSSTLSTNGFNDVNSKEFLKPTENSADLAVKHYATDFASGTTQPNITVTDMKPQIFKGIHEIKQAESSSFSNESSSKTNSQLISNNELTSSNKDLKESMPSEFLQTMKKMPTEIMVTPTSILAGIHRTEIPVKKIIHDNYATSVNWLAKSSMKLGKSSQHVILPISELKMHPEVSNTSDLISVTSTIRTKEYSEETINTSTSAFPANILLPLSVPLLAVTEIPSTTVVVQHERTAIDHSTIEKDSEVNLLQVNEKTSEPSYPKLYENEKKIAAGNYGHHWNSEFNTEISSPKILQNHLSERASKRLSTSLVLTQNNYLPNLTSSLHTHYFFSVGKSRNLIRNEGPQNTPIPGYQSKISKGSFLYL